MFKNFFHVFNKTNKLIENINFHIVNQSRKTDLFILFKIEDNFQNRLNLQILKKIKQFLQQHSLHPLYHIQL